MPSPDKVRVKDALLTRMRAELARMQDIARSGDTATRVAQDEVFSVDDLAQADEAGDMAGMLQRTIEQRQVELAEFEALDITPRDRVGPGAVVGFGGLRFLVGVTAGSFECDGHTYQGLSTGSPIYASVTGLGAGEEFTFRDRTRTIDFVA